MIAEFSEKPMPTRTSFRVSGVEQIVKFRKTDLVALKPARSGGISCLKPG